MYQALIMAGGSGTRLWPLSRENRPKQSINLSGGKTLFQHAVERLEPLFQVQQVWVVTRAAHIEQLHVQEERLPLQNFIVEPEGRGTAPAIGLAALYLHRRDPEAVMAVLAADHYIQDTGRFRQVLAAAEQVARQGHLVTLGIRPTSPVTGYGYIEQGDLWGEANGFPYFREERFVEKPDLENATKMVQSGRFSWNSGMFVWQVRRILGEFERQMPAFYRQLMEIDAVLGTAEYVPLVERLWPQVARQTLDYGIMEGAQDVAVIPVEMGWRDIGSWSSLSELLPADELGNSVQGEFLGLDTRGTLVIGEKRLIATLGVQDLVIVDTEDALLVCAKSEEQRVRELVERLKTAGRQDLL